ncbi:MAG: Paralytic/GBP/PSP peptide [Prochlorococcus sp.]|tara:strand:- start:2240 stop:2668 length:429 start_codon:yes stop_codon:yes gene_type:complete
MKGVNSILAAIGVMLLVFIIITTGKIDSQTSNNEQLATNQVTIEEAMPGQLATNQISTNQISTNQMAANQIATNQFSANKVNANQLLTEEVIAEEVSAKCAPGWVAAKDGIFCSPAIFRQLDVARQSDNKCWEGGMLLRCRE